MIKRTERWLRANAKPEVVELALGQRARLRSMKEAVEALEKQVRDLTAENTKLRRELAAERSRG